MFFPEKMKSIKKDDVVLEIGPENTPYYRSNILLENEDIAKLQAGGTEKKEIAFLLKTKSLIMLYVLMFWNIFQKIN